MVWSFPSDAKEKSHGSRIKFWDPPREAPFSISPWRCAKPKNGWEMSCFNRDVNGTLMRHNCFFIYVCIYLHTHIYIYIHMIIYIYGGISLHTFSTSMFDDQMVFRCFCLREMDSVGPLVAWFRAKAKWLKVYLNTRWSLNAAQQLALNVNEIIVVWLYHVIPYHYTYLITIQ